MFTHWSQVPPKNPHGLLCKNFINSLLAESMVRILAFSLTIFSCSTGSEFLISVSDFMISFVLLGNTTAFAVSLTLYATIPCEDIEVETLFDDIDREIADAAAGKADAKPAERADETRCRRDSGETSDHAGNYADQRRFAEVLPFDDHPYQRRGGGGNMGNGHGHAGATAGRQCAAGIEAEPADPKHSRTHHRQARAMWRTQMRGKVFAVAEQLDHDQC